MSDKNDKHEDEKVEKKPLSLGTLNLGGTSSTVDISKIIEEKAKKHRGKTRVEVRGTKKPLASEQEKELGKNNKSEDSSLLTQDEKELRAKLATLGSTKNEDSGRSSEDIAVTALKVVIKETIEKNKNVEDDTSDSLSNNTYVIKSKFEVKDSNSTKAKIDPKKQELLDDFDEEARSKKKKALATIEQKKHGVKNWKSLYDINSEDEEEFDEEEEAVEEVVRKTAYTVKRKNKRRHVDRTKLFREVEIVNSISVRELSQKMSEKSKDVLKALDKLGFKSSLNDVLDVETAELIITELGHTPKLIDRSGVESQYYLFDDKDEDLKERPPIVTIMGHVDHGKTTLLDTIRKANVVSQEAGGITQHIGAYTVHTPTGKDITFLDTPGHEAFSQIRVRGSKITDIVVIVVAADDGVKPQTIEAINHTVAAGVPIIIAINKIDKPDKNSQKVKTELLQYNIVVEEMGGDILCVEISAKNNIGVDKLLEAILLQAEVLDLKTNYKALGKAHILEIKQEKGYGILGTVLVQRGTLHFGDCFVSGLQSGKIKVMINDQGEKVSVAGPSIPVQLSGFSGVVEAGEDFIVVASESKAKELIEYRQKKLIKQSTPDNTQSILDFLSQQMTDVKVLSLIIKADTQGSLEAIEGSLKKMLHKDAEIKVIHSGIGEITESDVTLSVTARAVVIGFNVRGNSKARDIAKKEGVEIRYHSIIYNLIDDVKLILSGLLDPDVVENIVGYAEVRQVFDVSKVGRVAGCFVTEGVLKRSAFVRVLRNNIVIYNGVLSQLKRFKEDAKEVKQNFECGLSLESYNDLEVGDFVECYEKVEVANTIE